METVLLSFISISYFTSIEIDKDFFSFAQNSSEAFDVTKSLFISNYGDKVFIELNKENVNGR